MMSVQKTLTWLFICGAVLVPQATLALSPDQVKAWTEDIRFYLAEGERHHIDLYHHTDKRALHAAAEQLIRQLPELNENQVKIALLRIARLIGDGHSAVSIWYPGFKRLPFSLVDYRLDSFAEPYIVSTTQNNSALLGKKINAINGKPITEIAKQIAPITQYVENQYSISIRSKEFMVHSDILAGLGIVNGFDPVEITVVSDDGKTETYSVDFMNNDDYRGRDKLFVNSPNIETFTEPGYVLNDDLWIGTQLESKTAYIYFAVYPSFDNMNTFSGRERQVISENNIEHVIIDLRNNGGGDFFVGLLLASGLLGLDSIDWQNGVYTLIGSKVFSASMSNAAHYRQILNAKLVGSPTGANPIGYQETHGVQLPNSKMSVSFSKRLFKFQDQQSDGVQPHISVVNSLQDFKSGSDAVLDWVLNDISERQ